MSRCRYRIMNPPKDLYLGYIVAIDNPLSYHIHIHWPEKVREKYFPHVTPYVYRYASEEDPSRIHEGEVYICRLNNVNSIPSVDFSTTKVAYQLVSSAFRQRNNWVYLQIGDIDAYARILVNIYDIFTDQSLQSILFQGRTEKGDKIAEPYSRPKKSGIMISDSDKELLSISLTRS
jgi:hypothetical protein